VLEITAPFPTHATADLASLGFALSPDPPFHLVFGDVPYCETNAPQLDRDDDNGAQLDGGLWVHEDPLLGGAETKGGGSSSRQARASAPNPAVHANDAEDLD
jgi:hypothetical protein